jgi:hypothetical protein
MTPAVQVAVDTGPPADHAQCLAWRALWIRLLTPEGSEKRNALTVASSGGVNGKTVMEAINDDNPPDLGSSNIS